MAAATACTQLLYLDSLCYARLRIDICWTTFLAVNAALLWTCSSSCFQLCVCVCVCVHTCLCVCVCDYFFAIFFVFLTAGLLFCSCTLKLSWNYYIMGHMVGDLDLIGSWVVAYWTPDSACQTLWFGMFDSLARLVPFPGQRPPALGSWPLTMFQLCCQMFLV